MAEAALAHSGEMFLCATPKDIRVQVAGLYTVMPMQDRSAADLEILARIYAEDLMEYPIDVIAEAAVFWRRTEKWFPRISELRHRCDRVGRDRMAWKRALLDARSNPD